MHAFRPLALLGAVLAVGALGVPGVSAAGNSDPSATVSTSTPIKHLVVLFQENVSFDHYFGTYPYAVNPAGEPAFHAAPGTPTVNGLNETLLQKNPNQSNPQRLDRSQAHTCDQDHNYTHEQMAANAGAMDKFVENTGAGLTVQQCTGQATGTSPNYAVMDYYDGNTVTALWNYAQHYSMSDNSYSTVYGPSSPGALSLISGNTFGATCGSSTANVPACPAGYSTASNPGNPAPQGTGTVYGDPQPIFDKCDSRGTAQMGGRNVGDLLNGRSVTWGWFQGGFADCSAKHSGVNTSPTADYIPHHQPFQYYQSTANPMHLAPSSVSKIGQQDQANHQYDLTDFWKAADSNHLPAVSFLKAAAYQDGHAGYSDPLSEQTFLVQTINHLQQLPTWKSTAVVIAYDDSDGWYDHAMSPLITQSQSAFDALTGSGQCGANLARVPSGPTGPQQVRCGYGPRQPLLVISPFARQNSVDHSLTDQSSITRFIEDNWGTGRIGSGSADAWAGSLSGLFNFSHPSAPKLFLNPTTGQPVDENQAQN